VVYNSADPALRESFAETSLSMHFKHVDEQGRRYRERVINGKAYRYYADEGRRLGSVWTDIPAMVANTPLRREGTGYPTQKPERLLERIVRASSREHQTVADLMCGSGTTAAVAARLGRRFVAGDASPLAVEVSEKRLAAQGAVFTFLDARGLRPDKPGCAPEPPVDVTRSRAADPERASPRPAPPASTATRPSPDPE
jgi:site-specific DNA-methyltransferase (adenine-specific)